jgi:hypothetical protein
MIVVIVVANVERSCPSLLKVIPLPSSEASRKRKTVSLDPSLIQKASSEIVVTPLHSLEASQIQKTLSSDPSHIQKVSKIEVTLLPSSEASHIRRLYHQILHFYRRLYPRLRSLCCPPWRLHVYGVRKTLYLIKVPPLPLIGDFTQLEDFATY